jgi:ribosome-associated protein
LNLSQKAKSASPIEDEAFHDLIIDCIQDIKGKHIVKLDLRALPEAPASYFIICEGDSNTQIRGISDRIITRVRDEAGIRPLHVEGKIVGRWVLVDYGATVVHIFYPETRAHYDLEDLWSDAAFTKYENL